MRNFLLASLALLTLALGLGIAALANENHALGERVLRMERANQDLVLAIEELDAELWRRGLELDREALGPLPKNPGAEAAVQ